MKDLKNLTCRNGTYYFVKQSKGVSYYETLQTSNPGVARARRDKILKQMAAGTYQKTEKPEVLDVTIGDLINTYRDAASEVHESEKTASSNVGCLVAIVTTCFPQHKKNTAEETHATVAALPIETINRTLAHEFISRTLKAARTKPERETAKRRVKSHFRHAKSLFSRWAITTYEEAGLKLPPCVQEFKSYTPALKTSKDKYLSRPPDLIARTITAGRDLPEDQPELYLVFVLAYDLAMRANEIAHARKDWITTNHQGKPILRIQTAPGFRPKSGEARDIPIHPQIHHELQELFLRFPGDFIIPGVSHNMRKNLIIREFAYWMRQLGWHRDQYKHCAHELRALQGSRWFTQVSPQAAQKLLGHESISTTCQFYADFLGTPEALPVDHTGVFHDHDRAAL